MMRRIFVSIKSPQIKAHLNILDLICATCGWSPPVGRLDNLCVRFISVHCALVFQMHPGDPAPTGEPLSISAPLGAPSRCAHKPPLPPAVWRNMAPIRPIRTARLCPLNTRLPPSKSITVKYDSLEVDSRCSSRVLAELQCGTG